MQQNKNKKPFFARFLESQDAGAATGACGIRQTKKYPSDNDEMVTLKYPSDNEDGGGGGPVTLKYPSDSDENGSNS